MNEGEKVSNCCSAPVYEETDICTNCKEHCDLVETEPSVDYLKNARKILDK